jgi:hypothetical protein
MSKVIYTKLAADGTELPRDTVEKHLAVRVRRTDFPGWHLDIAAYRCAGEHNFDAAQKVGAAHDAYGWPWRTGTPEELFLIKDRTDPSRSLPTEFFPDAEEYEFTWTNQVDATSPSGYAWYVHLGSGDSSWYRQSDRSSVRAVRASQ